MKQVNCAICGNKQQLEDLYQQNFDAKKINSKTFSARRLPDNTHYTLVRCKRCGLIFSRDILNPQKILSLYRKSNFTYSLESRYLGKTYATYLKKYITVNGNKSTLLDIGCGNGFFLEEAKKIGIDHVWGVEPGTQSVAKAHPTIRSYIKTDIFRPKLFKEKSFDIICCFHTLDHIIDPNTFLDTVYKLLKKNGVVFFVTHDTNGLSVKLFKEKSPIFDIEHIYLFNKASLKKIFVSHGFRNGTVFNIVNTYPLLYWIKMVPLPLLIKKSIVTVLQFSRLGLLPIPIGAGNIGIIAKK